MPDRRQGERRQEDRRKMERRDSSGNQLTISLKTFIIIVIAIVLVFTIIIVAMGFRTNNDTEEINEDGIEVVDINELNSTIDIQNPNIDDNNSNSTNEDNIENNISIVEEN